MAHFLFSGLTNALGSNPFRFNDYRQPSNPNLFPDTMADGRIDFWIKLSGILANIPLTAIDYIFAASAVAEEATAWTEANREKILTGAEK